MSAHDWFITYTGRKVHVLSPKPEDFDLQDIAHALSHVCRFSGHVREFYSVAQHSVHVSTLVPPEQAAAALLHDAAEAYIGDVIRPLKRELRDYAAIEDNFERCIAERFGVVFGTPEIKLADHCALFTERRILQPEATLRALSGELRWVEDELGVQPDETPLVPMSPLRARAAFLVRAQQVGLGTAP